MMLRRFLVSVFLIAVLSMFLALPASGGVKSAALREAIEVVQRKFGREVMEEFGETGAAGLARKMDVLAAKHGDELVADAAQKVGPQMFRHVEEVGEDGSLQALKLMSRRGDDAIWVVSKPGRFSLFVKYGDDAADAMIKHGEISEALISQFGRSGSKAMAAVDGQQQAVRLARMASEGDLAKMAQPSGVLDVVGRYGDRGADWVWRHKGALAVASISAAFVSNPEPFLNGAVEVVQVGSEYVLRPVAEEVAKSLNWNLWVTIAATVLVVLLVIKFGWGWLMPQKEHVTPSEGAP